MTGTCATGWRGPCGGATCRPGVAETEDGAGCSRDAAEAPARRPGAGSRPPSGPAAPVRRLRGRRPLAMRRRARGRGVAGGVQDAAPAVASPSAPASTAMPAGSMNLVGRLAAAMLSLRAPEAALWLAVGTVAYVSRPRPHPARPRLTRAPVRAQRRLPRHAPSARRPSGAPAPEDLGLAHHRPMPPGHPTPAAAGGPRPLRCASPPPGPIPPPMLTRQAPSSAPGPTASPSTPPRPRRPSTPTATPTCGAMIGTRASTSPRAPTAPTAASTSTSTPSDAV
jgi:hypothetical protein